MSKAKKATAPHRPEKRFGPFHNGIGIAIWLNEQTTENGPRYFRSITFNARRYRAEDGTWKDASSYRPVDLTTFEMALTVA